MKANTRKLIINAVNFCVFATAFCVFVSEKGDSTLAACIISKAFSALVMYACAKVYDRVNPKEASTK